MSESHQISNLYSSVVTVGIEAESSKSLIGSFGKWVGNNTVTGLEANFWLEGVLTNGANHLERNIRTVEDTSIICARTFVTNNVVLVSINVSRIRINIDLILTLENTSEGVASVVNVKVSVECGSVIKYTAIVRAEATSAEQMITLPFPLRVLCAIALASRSIWKRRPLNFSTDQRPLESTSRSKVPAVAVFA